MGPNHSDAVPLTVELKELNHRGAGSSSALKEVCHDSMGNYQSPGATA
jgi:hypothetical protein